MAEAGIIVTEGQQTGSTLGDIIQIISDDWGYNPASNRFRNMIKRRTNRVIRDIYNTAPKLYMLRVVDQPLTIKAGIANYDAPLSPENGGFGWTNCVEVLMMVFNDIDNRPLERLDWEQFRERSQIFAQTGPPQSFVVIDGRRVKMHPKPDMDYTGFGDYLAELPTLTDDDHQIEGWPRSWDEVIVDGVQYYTALARLRERPSSVGVYERRYQLSKTELEIKDKTRVVRPFGARTTRSLRSRRTLPSDNSTDIRYWRRW